MEEIKILFALSLSNYKKTFLEEFHEVGIDKCLNNITEGYEDIG